MQQEASVRGGPPGKVTMEFRQGSAHAPVVGNKPRGISARQDGAFWLMHIFALFASRGDFRTADRSRTTL